MGEKCREKRKRFIKGKFFGIFSRIEGYPEKDGKMRADSNRQNTVISQVRHISSV